MSKILQFIRGVTLKIVRTYFFFRTTNEIDLWRDELLKPFDVKVWISLTLLVILISFLLRIVFIFDKEKTETTANPPTFLITFGAFCQQGRKLK